MDLAGSERIGKTGAVGKVLEEAKKINQSLSSLGRVIKSISEGDKHIPFRDSKLTHLLKESIGGNSKTCLICTLSRRSGFLEESIQSLKFAKRVKMIKNKAITNIQKSHQEMKLIIQRLKNENYELKAQLFD